MATQVEELAVRFSAQTEELTRELNRLSATAARAGKKTSKKLGGIQKSLNAIGRAAKSAGGLLAGAFAIRELFNLGIHFKNAARDAEEMESKFDAVFKSASDDVRVWADDLAKEVNRSRFALMDFASTFQDTFVPLGFARGEAAKLSKTLVELAIDVSSFSNKLETDVIRDFQSALVGNTETVRKYGIVITEARLNQEILNSGLAQSKKEITELNKVQGRLNLIMKGTSDAHGDAARTAGSQANKEKELNAALEELSITMGQLLAPATLRSTEALIDWTRAFNEFISSVKGPTELEELQILLDNLFKRKLNLLGPAGSFFSNAEIDAKILKRVNDEIDQTIQKIDTINRKKLSIFIETEKSKELQRLADELEAKQQLEAQAALKAIARAKETAESISKIEMSVIGATHRWEKNQEKDKQDFLTRIRKRIWDNQAKLSREAAQENQRILERSLFESEMIAMAFADTFLFAFEDLIFSGEKLGKILQSLLSDIARIALRKAVIEPLAGKLGATLSAAFGFAKGGVMTGSGPANLNSYASGGIARSPQLALFGEGTRPEAFVPLPDGRSIPVTMSNGGGGGNTFINNNHFDTKVEKDMFASIAQAAPLISASTLKALAQAQSGVNF